MTDHYQRNLNAMLEDQAVRDERMARFGPSPGECPYCGCRLTDLGTRDIYPEHPEWPGVVAWTGEEHVVSCEWCNPEGYINAAVPAS